MHMHGVLQHIKAHHLAPAIAWARQQRATHDREGLASLEFRLHRMRFMQLLQARAPAPCPRPPSPSTDSRKVKMVASELSIVLACESPSSM